MNPLERLYLFTGELRLETALHVGGGDVALGSTDSPIIRYADERPFIPGSSIKGAFRATVEKLATTLSLANMEHVMDVLDTGSKWMQEFNRRRRDEQWSEEETIKHIEREWPATAFLFGTPYTASRILFEDATPLEEEMVVVQRRDGVAIDRDSERAVEGLKYDYEVVAPGLRLHFAATLQNPTDRDLQLTCAGMMELVSGFFSLGGKRSSGLGRCRLENLHIYELDLHNATATERMARLRRYLIGKTLDKKLEPVPGDPIAWMQQHIQALLATSGGQHQGGQHA
jgi:CRISPR-associated RAMP protein (TIGR02581 family)